MIGPRVDRTVWKPVDFDSFDDVPMHYRPLVQFDPEIRAVYSLDGLLYFHKPSTDQYWIQIGFKEDKHGIKHCPVDECGAQCCKESTPWPNVFPMAEKPCMFLKDDLKCGIQGSKFICCIQAPEPWNSMNRLDKCQLRCVEVKRG